MWLSPLRNASVVCLKCSDLAGCTRWPVTEGTRLCAAVRVLLNLCRSVNWGVVIPKGPFQDFCAGFMWNEPCEDQGEKEPSAQKVIHGARAVPGAGASTAQAEQPGRSSDEESQTTQI